MSDTVCFGARHAMSCLDERCDGAMGQPAVSTTPCALLTLRHVTRSCFELAQFSSSQLLAAAQEEDGERERGRKRGREGGAGLPLAPPSSFLLRALLFQQGQERYVRRRGLWDVRY